MQPLKRPTVINRRELPLIVRNPRERRPFWLIVAILAFLVWGFLSGTERSGESVLGTSNLTVENVSLRPVSSKNGTSWLVTGKLVNPTTETLSAPDLDVRLLRSDGSVAAEDKIAMQAQIMPAQSAVAFSTRLATGPGEELSAEVKIARTRSP